MDFQTAATLQEQLQQEPMFPSPESFLLDSPLIYTQSSTAPCFDPSSFAAFGDDFHLYDCNNGTQVMMDSFHGAFGFQDIKPVNFAVPEEGKYKNTHHQFQHQDRATAELTRRRACVSASKGGKKSNVVKSQWSIEEDRVLIELVGQVGVRKWSNIAQMLPGRIGKQCRERWHNHLRPDIKKDTWSEEEDKVLIKSHSEIGNRWAEIAKKLPGRTENSIKNHWNATKRRQFSKRKCRSKYPKPSLLQDYINTLNLLDNKPKTTPITQSTTLDFSQTTDRLVPDYSYDLALFEHQSCSSIGSLLDDMSSPPPRDHIVSLGVQVKKELDLVEMISQVNNN